MTILNEITLGEHTTFHVGGPARFFSVLKNDKDVEEAVSFINQEKVRYIVIGGGSNILFSDKGFDGLVIKNEIDDLKINDNLLEVGAGVNWDAFVENCLHNSLFGLENLSYIPGTVGASPVQNIGAYGAQVSDFIEKVRAFDVKENKWVNLSNQECNFSYRDSLFKQEKGRYIITKVFFRLKKEAQPNISYKDLKEYFANAESQSKQMKRITPDMVREAVIAIRKSKLPDWNKWGTAGSFFKNPIVDKELALKLKEKYPEWPMYEELVGRERGRMKISLGWFLDHVCNMKGQFVGNVGTYKQQSLVIVSKIGATAGEVVEFSRKIANMVYDKIGVKIEAEVEIVN